MDLNKRVSELRNFIRRVMSDCGVDAPNLEADRILCHVLGTPRARILSHPEMELSGEQYNLAVEMARRRAKDEPLAYILGDAVFCGRSLKVDKRTLIPRPETEVLTGIVDEYLKKKKRGVFADWCTGSGCIAVSLCADNQDFKACAVDSSRGALEIAGQNAELYGVADRIKFIECAEPLSAPIEGESLEMIVANPPYIPSNVINALEPQVRDFEPHEALDGGIDGLGVYRLLFGALPYFLKPGGALFLETGGTEQILEIISFVELNIPYMRIENILNDQRGLKRFMLWRKFTK